MPAESVTPVDTLAPINSSVWPAVSNLSPPAPLFTSLAPDLRGSWRPPWLLAVSFECLAAVWTCHTWSGPLGAICNEFLLFAPPKGAAPRGARTDFPDRSIYLTSVQANSGPAIPTRVAKCHDSETNITDFPDRSIYLTSVQANSGPAIPTRVVKCHDSETNIAEFPDRSIYLTSVQVNSGTAILTRVVKWHDSETNIADSPDRPIYLTSVQANSGPAIPTRVVKYHHFETIIADFPDRSIYLSHFCSSEFRASHPNKSCQMS